MRITKRQLGLSLYFSLLIFLVLAGISVISGLLTWLLPLPKEIPEVLAAIIISDLLSGIATVFISRKLIEPILDLSSAMRKVAGGDFTVRMKTDSKIGELRDLHTNFNMMVTELSATEMLQSDFVANVSHEFKTPINAIEGYTMLLQGDENLSEEQNENIKKILYNTGRLSGLVSNILLLSKIDNQNISMNLETFRLDEQLRQAIVALEPKWSEKKLELDAELEDVSFFGSETLLYHVWSNLIDNAVKYNPIGGSIFVRLQASEQNVLVSVTDSGPGIPEQQRQRIFEKFYQVDSSHKNDGNGLGLALVKRVVTMHEGSIAVENVPKGGCKFTVVLPIRS